MFLKLFEPTCNIAFVKRQIGINSMYICKTFKILLIMQSMILFEMIFKVMFIPKFNKNYLKQQYLFYVSTRKDQYRLVLEQQE
jgi:hypothetical protein